MDNDIKIQKDITAQNTELHNSFKKIEELENLIAEMRSFYNNSQDIFYKVDLEGILIHISPSIQKYGYNRDESVGHSILDFYYNIEDRAVFTSIIMERKSINDYEIKFKSKVGEPVYCSISAKLVYNQGNEPCAIEGIIRDITKRHKIEENLKKSEELYKALVNNAFEGILILSLEGEILFVNPAFCRLLKVKSIDDVLGQSIFQFIAPEYHQKAIYEFGKVAKGEDSFVSEYRGYSTQGDLVIFETIGKLITFEGEPADLVSISDITEKKLAEEEAKRQSDFRQLLVETSSKYINMPLDKIENEINNSLNKLAVFVKADRAYIFDFNIKTELCSNTYEWCNEGITPYIDELQNIRLPDRWIELFRDGLPVYIQDTYTLEDNWEREVLLEQDVKSLICVPLMEGNICIGFIGFDSVKEYHTYTKTEQDLLSVFAEMIVNIKNRKKQSEELIKAKEKAEESDRLKSAFLSNISHEIRTPLNGIVGFMNLLNQPELSISERENYIKVINESSNRLLDTIGNIIEISKLEAGQILLNRETISLNEIMTEYYETFLYSITKKHLEYRISNTLENKNFSITTDMKILDRVLSILLKNAIKYTSNGFIEFGNFDDSSKIIFYIKDSGIGISKEKQEMIFDRFMQAETDDARQFEGTGLGLSIVKEYLKLLNGKIWLESEIGNGTTFYFSIRKSE